MQRYDQSVQEWIARHPEWAGIIAGSVVSEAYVRSRLDFRWQVFRVAPPAHTPPGALGDHLQSDVTRLGQTLFGEVAKDAAEAWRRCYAGKTEITRKALSPLKTMYDKLMGLTFVEPRVAPIAELLDTAFRSIPKRGPISGSLLVMLQGLVALLQNPTALVEHGQMILDGRKNPHKILGGLFLQECEAQLHEETLAAQEADEQEKEREPVMTPPPVLKSHGLW